MFALINRCGSFIGIFSTIEKMQMVIKGIIQGDYEKNGYHGNYNFRWIEFKMDEPWFNDKAEYNKEVGKALFSLSTMHEEYFTHKVKTNWNTGEIISMDADYTTDIYNK